MSAESQPGAPAPLPSRAWSAGSLQRGVEAVQTESKAEPWSDDESDETLQLRIQDLFSMMLVPTCTKNVFYLWFQLRN